MRAARWFIAMLGAFAAFILPLWAWHALNLPPQGANQLSVALGAAAVVSAVVGAPLFWWAGLDSDTARPWDLIATRTSDGWLEDVQAKMRSIWVTEGLGRSLEVVAAIELGFTERPDAVAVPMRNATPNAPATVFPIGTSLLSIFESDKAGRRLLLLGQRQASREHNCRVRLRLSAANDLHHQLIGPDQHHHRPHGHRSTFGPRAALAASVTAIPGPSSHCTSANIGTVPLRVEHHHQAGWIRPTTVSGVIWTFQSTSSGRLLGLNLGNPCGDGGRTRPESRRRH
jgi:hypothetical protein